MVTDKPPRRTKSRKEPVTIDATASKTEAVAEPVRSNDSDDKLPGTPAEETVDSENVTTDAPPVEPTASRSGDDVTVADLVASSKEARKEENPAQAESEPHTFEPTPPPVQGTRTEPAFAERPRQGASASTLVAAGIFGGIVALALAGSMQYAGFLPNGGGANDTGATEEIAALRQQVEALGQDQGSDPDLQARVQALEAAASENGNDDVTQRLAALEQQLSEVRSAGETASSERAGQIDQLQQRLDTLETQVNQPGPEQAAARAITAAALKAAIDQGGAFESELQTFSAAAPDDTTVSGLQPYAQDGVPTQTRLVERFSEVSSKIIEAVNQPGTDQGIASRLMSSAMSVVKVRRTGDVEGDTPEATVARIETALQNGKLAEASAAWDTLPEEGKAVSQDFKKALDARIAVDGLISDTVARAVSETADQNQGATE